MKDKETTEEYIERMSVMYERINHVCEGEYMDELVIVLSRLTLAILARMEPKERREMAALVREYIRVALDDEDHTLN